MEIYERKYMRKPSLDLELNIHSISDELANLVGDGRKMCGSFSDSLGLSDLSNDGYSQHMNQGDDFSPSSQEFSSFNDGNTNYYDQHESQYYPEEEPINFYEAPSQEIFIPPQPPITSPMITPIQGFVSTFHPNFGNMFVPLLPSTQINGFTTPTLQVIQPQLVVPYYSGFPIGTSPEEYLRQQKLAQQNCLQMARRSGRNFNKKYPRRSEKDFNVVPSHYKLNECDENLDSVVINLRELNIGPESLYESKQTKLIKLFIKALEMLSSLAHERSKIDFMYTHKTVPDTKSIPQIDFTRDITGYRFMSYVKAIIDHAEVEQFKVKSLLSTLKKDKKKAFQHKTSFIEHHIEILYNVIASVKRLIGLSILSQAILDIADHPNELEIIKSTCRDFIKVIGDIASSLWSFGILNEEILISP
uniref:CSON006289 protein n=1 Tax=Culicoides sonorensis TaxID=179676 RepID=A0A336MSY9_CULSO